MRPTVKPRRHPEGAPATEGSHAPVLVSERPLDCARKLAPLGMTRGRGCDRDGQGRGTSAASIRPWNRGNYAERTCLMSRGAFEQLVQRRTDEPAFREAVQRDPKGTIERAGYQLDEQEWTSVRDTDWSQPEEELRTRMADVAGRASPPL